MTMGEKISFYSICATIGMVGVMNLKFFRFKRLKREKPSLLLNISKKKNLWIVLDFWASQRNMHQLLYVKKYSDYIQNFYKEDTLCWIPSTTDTGLVKEIGLQKTELILKSPEYTVHQNFGLFVITRIILNFLNWKFLQSIKWLAHFFRTFFSIFYLIRAYNRLLFLSKKYETIHLVFPCSSPLSIRLLEMIQKSKRNKFKAHLIFSTGENKGVFRFHNFENKIRQLAATMSLTIGTETITYQKEIDKIYSFGNKIKWSPTPYSPPRKYTKITRDAIALGFLGTARPNKGFETIPGLLKKLKSCDVAFTAIIQKAIYPWEEYHQSIYDINNLELTGVNFISANLSHEEFILQFEKVDVLILPYFKEFYKFAGSAILFMAADYGIPIIAPQGLSFEWDILNFGIGYTYSSESDFVNCVENCKSQDFSSNFLAYNKKRSLLNIEFLQK